MAELESAIKSSGPTLREEPELRKLAERDSGAGVPLPSRRQEHPILGLQRTFGNRAVGRMLGVGVFQPKLTIGAPDDVYEKEADEVAEKIGSETAARRSAGAADAEEDDRGRGLQRARSAAAIATLRRIPIRTLQQTLGNRALARLLQEAFPAPSMPGLRRKCACGGGSEEECPECKTKREAVQRVSSGGDAGLEAPPIVEDVLGTPGQPLAESARRTLEPSFGHDFSQVRVHDDSRAAESASAVSAVAYTVGNHIVFGAGKYAPGTTDGNRLLAHELTHTIQQTGGAVLGSNVARLPETEGNQVQRDSDDSDSPGQTNPPPAAAPADQPAGPAPGSPDQTPDDSGPVSLEPLSVEAESQGPTVEGCDGLSLHGKTTPTFRRNSTVENQSASKGQDCSCAKGVQCLHVTGTRVTNYSVSVAISMPPVPGGLTPCERSKVQDFLDNVLRPHELDHKAKFETYNGQTKNPLDITGCGRDGINRQIGAIQDAENTPRQAAAQALSDSIDPFMRTIDCSDCQKQSAAPGAGQGGGAAKRMSSGGGAETAIAAKRMSSDGGSDPEAFSMAEDIISTPGQPLAESARRTLEPSFGHDFGHVRVHDDSKAAESASAVNAHAYTVGNHIVFGAGRYAPGTADGNRLLAHELTHTVQQGASAPGPSSGASSTPSATAAPKIQRAWYNFDIPFTDYQFDPSLEGIKTAANVVKDTAVAGFEWIVDQIKSLVASGIDWLNDKWNSLQEFASSAFDSAKNSFTNIIGFIKSPLSFLADGLMSLDAQALTKAWATFSGLVSKIANGFKAMTDNLLQQVNGIWGGINGFATSLLDRVSSLTENFIFKKLPDALQRIAFTVIDRLKSLWKSVNDGWTALFNKIKGWIDSALDSVFSFVRRVLSFGINVVIAGIVEFGKIVLFLKDLFANPRKYVDLLAKRSVEAFGPVESRFAGVVGQYFGSAKSAAPASAVTTRIQRSPGPEAAAETRKSATWGEIGQGITEMMGKKWDAFKSNPMAIITGLLMDMIFPIVGDVKDVVQLFQDIKKIVTGPLSAGSLEELWTSLLQILDIPILIYHTVVSILMRTLMIPLIVATFIPHPLVKAIAAAVGYGLLGAFVQAEMLNLGQKLLLLKTGVTTKADKQDAYNRIADSLIALAMAAVIIIIMLILHFIANVMKGVYNFVKGKVFAIEPAPVEGKGTAPDPNVDPDKAKPPGDADLGFENGKRVTAEEPTADQKHTIKIIEGGECLYCTNCGSLAKEYAIELNDPKNAGILSELDTADQISNAKIKARRMAQIEEKLAQIRKDNPHPNDPALSRSARIQLLARDPAHGGKVTPGSVREAEVAVSLEESGQVQGPIQRDPTGAADFIDGNGTPWDVKGFNSHQPIAQGGFDLATDAAKVDTSLAQGENVMVDTGQMTADDVKALKAEGAKPPHNWGDKVKFFP